MTRSSTAMSLFCWITITMHCHQVATTARLCPQYPPSLTNSSISLSPARLRLRGKQTATPITPTSTSGQSLVLVTAETTLPFQVDPRPIITATKDTRLPASTTVFSPASCRATSKDFALTLRRLAWKMCQATTRRGESPGPPHSRVKVSRGTRQGTRTSAAVTAATWWTGKCPSRG